MLQNSKRHCKNNAQCFSSCKVLRNGVAGYAFVCRCRTAFGAVDWVLDAENNKIRYRTEPDQCQYLYKYKGKDYCPNALAAAANKFYLDMGFENPDCSVHIPNVGGTATIECAGLGGTVGSASPILNPDYSETAEDDYPKSIPLETVAQKVISNAAAVMYQRNKQLCLLHKRLLMMLKRQC